MQKQFKSFKEDCRYLVKNESYFWDTSLVEIYVLEISEKAIKIEFDNGDTKWYLKETFNFSMIENLSSSLNTLENSNDLEWQQNPPTNIMNWYEAMEYAKSLGEGWRLPTRGELSDAYDNKIEGFILDDYWSSITYDQAQSYAWSVDFSKGYVDYFNKKDSDYVRCVREVKNPKQTIEDRSHEIQFDDDWKDNEYDATLKLE